MNTANLQQVIDVGRRFASKDAELSVRLREAAGSLERRTDHADEWPLKLYPEAKSLHHDLVAFTSGNGTVPPNRLAARFYDLCIDLSAEVTRHFAEQHQRRREEPGNN